MLITTNFNYLQENNIFKYNIDRTVQDSKYIKKTTKFILCIC